MTTEELVNHVVNNESSTSTELELAKRLDITKFTTKDLELAERKGYQDGYDDAIEECDDGGW